MRRVVYNWKEGLVSLLLPAISQQLPPRKESKFCWWIWIHKATPHTTCWVDLGRIFPNGFDCFNDWLRFTSRVGGLRACIHSSPFKGLDVLPSHPDLEELQAKLEMRYKMFKLRELLLSLSEY